MRWIIEQDRMDDRSDRRMLTRRELEVLHLLAIGMRTDQIAHSLEVAPVTVEFHLRNARKKLGASTREHAVAIALAHNLIKPYE